MPPMSCLRCWSISYPKEKPFPSLVALYSLTFSFPWGSQIAICSQQWLTTITWPSANPCYMASNVPRCPPLSQCCILYLWLCKRSCTDHPGAPPLLLWTQGNQPLLLCGPTSPSSGLLRHLCQWNCHVCGGWFQPHVFSRHHPHLLHFHILQPFCKCILQKGGTRPSPPVGLIWQLLLCFMGHCSGCIWGRLQWHL